MMKIMMAFALIAALGTTTGAMAANKEEPVSDGVFSSTDDGFKWRPSRKCKKPVRPRRFDEFSHESYITAAQDFVECLKKQADHDANYARDKVVSDAQKMADVFVREVERGY